MKLQLLQSARELRDVSRDWDDLWYRSDLSLPTLRAEMLAQWLEHFAPRQQFMAVTVQRDGQLVAALPLIGTRKANVLPVATLPCNSWSSAGDLLVDADEDLDEVLTSLITGLRKLPWPIVWLDEVEIESRRWQTMKQLLDERGHGTATQLQYYLGRVDIDGDWDAYQASLSKNHRQALRNTSRRLDKIGETRLVRHAHLEGSSLEELLRKAFQIEDLGWKGEEGTSILKTPGMFDFFLRQARQLADWGQLELWLLEHLGQPIAFEYCYLAKETCYSHKISFDPEFRSYGPGRLLRRLQLEALFTEGEVRLFDTMGVLCESKAKWCTQATPLSRLVAGTGGLAGRAMVGTYSRIWPLVRRLRGTNTAPELPRLGPASRAGQNTNLPVAAAAE